LQVAVVVEHPLVADTVVLVVEVLVAYALQ
jgi:hypothetical protein